MPIGVPLQKRGNYAAVQIRGYVTLPYTGTAPALGWQELVTNGAQGLRTVTTGEAGKACLVVRWTRRQAPWGCFFEQKGEGTMAYSYETVRLDKGMYGEAGHSFTQVLEKCDPSEQYRGDAAGAPGRLSAAAEAV